VAAVAMTDDAKHLATLGASFPQALSIWDWASCDQPLYTTTFSPEFGLQTHIAFCGDNRHLLISNSEHQVIFFSSESGGLKHHAPELDDKTFNKIVGHFSQSVFIPSTTRAMTATSTGNVVVWDHARPEGPGAPAVLGNPMMKKPLKMIQLQESAITVITLINDCVVTGDSAGHVKFYDSKMRLKNWWDDFDSGPVTAISFAHTKYKLSNKSSYPTDTTIKANPFIIPNFIVATSHAIILHFAVNNSQKDLIHREHSAAIHALASHSFKPWLLIGSYAGLLKLWDYNTKMALSTKQFEKQQCIQCVALDPKGQYAAVGFTNGSMQVVDGLSLQNECPLFKHSHDCVTHVAFSHDSQYLATAVIRGFLG
jgi:WD40 repeat protein